MHLLRDLFCEGLFDPAGCVSRLRVGFLLSCPENGFVCNVDLLVHVCLAPSFLDALLLFLGQLGDMAVHGVL